MNLAKFSKAARDAEVFLAQCPNIGEAHLVMAQVYDKSNRVAAWARTRKHSRETSVCACLSGGSGARTREGALCGGTHMVPTQLPVGRSMRYTDNTTVDQTRMPKTGSNGK
jgi:hypothetical protein